VEEERRDSIIETELCNGYHATYGYQVQVVKQCGTSAPIVRLACATYELAVILGNTGTRMTSSRTCDLRLTRPRRQLE
jgi:hypothetical protein